MAMDRQLDAAPMAQLRRFGFCRGRDQRLWASMYVLPSGS